MHPRHPSNSQYYDHSQWPQGTPSASQRPRSAEDAADWFPPTNEATASRPPYPPSSSFPMTAPTSYTHPINPSGLPSMPPPTAYTQPQGQQSLCSRCGGGIRLSLGPSGSLQPFCQRCYLRSHDSAPTFNLPNGVSSQAYPSSHVPGSYPALMGSEGLTHRPYSDPPYGLPSTRTHAMSSTLHSFPDETNSQPSPSSYPRGLVDSQPWSYPTTPLTRASSMPSMSGDQELPTVLLSDLYSDEASTSARQVIKTSVATPKSEKASVDRRKVPAKYACEVSGCGSTFTKKHNRDSHVRAHYGQKPYMCKWCERTFTRPNDCTRHERDTCKRRPSK